MSSVRTSDVLIVGTGIAGLSAALKFAAHKTSDFKITLLCKAKAIEGSTSWAQGGIASVWSKDDTFSAHEHDTRVSGADLCDDEIVQICVQEGPKRVQELIELGVEFTKNENNEFDLHREGGHGQRRILHADDMTGLAIEKALLAQVKSLSNIELLENFTSIDLIQDSSGRCVGIYALNNLSGEVETFGAHLTILATGGAGKVYLYTSNPDIATGDGIAMAYRAGAQIANLEFMQFHPTCLHHPQARTFLITEALRGEGAVLKNLGGEAFMDRYDPRGNLAPRDIVARAIDMEIKKRGEPYVLLDCLSLGEAELKNKFPNIYETCLKYGIDISKQAIPIVPAAHYMCGGVKVDQNGKTSIPSLYALGEVACTGLHGANRLASNSLLEAVVFAHRVYLDGVKTLSNLKKNQSLSQPLLRRWDTGHAVEIEEQIDVAATWLEIRSVMWNYVGIVRSNKRLERAKNRLALLKKEINKYYWDFLLTRDLIELRNLVTVADLIVDCALKRKESRGLHYTVDFPNRNDLEFKKDTVICGAVTKSQA
jgi:L-aspartate oxidase